MGILDLMKKAVAKINAANQATPKQEPKVSITFTETVNGKTQTVTVDESETDDDMSVTDYDHLTKDGDLPWGWIMHNNDPQFLEQIGKEYTYFSNMWLDSKDKSPKELYPALKSFVMYLDAAGKRCEAKGECFEFWYYNYLTSNDYITKRKSELEKLTANFDKLQADFEKRAVHLSDLDERIIKMLIENPGVLQSDFVKMFDPLVQNDVRGKLYFMEKAGELERTKSGRSYILNYTRKG